ARVLRDQLLQPPPLRLETPVAQDGHGADESQREQCARQPEPPSLPERRHDGDARGRRRRARDAVVVQRDDLERVAAGRESAVADGRLRRRLRPLFARADQTVAVAYGGLVAEARRGEVELDDALPERYTRPVTGDAL